MDKTWTDADAKLLRELRTASGQDRANFARRCTISVAQLTELEDGGSGRFYSDRIKAHTGHNLLVRLGHPGAAEQPQAPAVARAPEPAPAPASARTDLAATEATVVQAPVDRMDQPSRPNPDPVEAAETHTPPASRQAAGGTARVGIIGAVIIIGALLVWMNQRGSSRPATVVSDPQPAPPAASMASDPAVPPMPAGAVSAPPAASAPASAPAAPKASAPASAPAPLPAAQASDRAAGPSATASPSTAAAGGRCETAPSQVAQYSPQRPSKAGNYVHLESGRDVTVCITDGQKRQVVAAVRPGDGVTVSGEPPFTLQTAALGEVRVFFQGVRVPVETLGAVQAVTLVPR
jgi:hypothetical protein